MKQASGLDDQWVDIITPPPPPSEAWFWWLLILVSLIIVGAIVVFLWHRQAHNTARRQIKKLSKQIRNEQADNKALLKELEHILCNCFRVPHLSMAVIQDSQWPLFLTQLYQACYQAQTPNDQLARQLLIDAGLFIKNPTSN